VASDMLTYWYCWKSGFNGSGERYLPLCGGTI